MIRQEYLSINNMRYTYFELNTYKKLLIFLTIIFLVAIPIDIIILNQSTIICSEFKFSRSVTSPSSPPFDELSQQQKDASTDKTCTLTPSLIEVEGTPQQIEGPYFVDGMPNRSDLRSEPSDDSMQEGIPLNITVNVYKVLDSDGDGKGTCVPFNGAKVDLWEANSQGRILELEKMVQKDWYIFGDIRLRMKMEL